MQTLTMTWIMLTTVGCTSVDLNPPDTGATGTAATLDDSTATRAAVPPREVATQRATTPERTARQLRTTSSALAIRNLDGMIRRLERLGAGGRPILLRKLVDARLLRAQFLGVASDLRRAEEETGRAVRASPNTPPVWIMRARALAATHRFKEASAAVERAAQLGAPAASVEPLRLSYAAAAGDLDAMRRQLQSARRSVTGTKTFGTYAALAAALTNMGRFAEADEAFVAAQGAYRNVSPFTRAWVDFQRGVMWAERANDPARALPLYEAAVERVPEYHTAVVHLAELLVEEEQAGRAITLLRRVIERAEDPEAAGTLGELLVATGDTTAGQALIAKARRDYLALLETMPAAFSDHAAEFFLAREDMDRATALADANLAHRKTGRAFDLAIRVHVAAHNQARACALVEAAKRLADGHPVLAETIRSTSCAPEATPAP